MAHIKEKRFGAGLMVNLRPRVFLCLLLLSGWCGLSAGIVAAQPQGKPYQQWTASETERLLTDSPWAQTRVGLISGERQDPAQIIETKDTAVTVRLHSALPVRQGLARRNQLKNNYAKKNEAARSTIDDANRLLLECADCADYYVVAMRPGPGSNNAVPTLERMTLAQVNLNVHLKNEKGEFRPLVKFVNPRFNDEEAMFFFSRFDSKGEPLINPANHKLIVSFEPGFFGWARATLTKFEFDVAKITVNGQVIF